MPLHRRGDEGFVPAVLAVLVAGLLVVSGLAVLQLSDAFSAPVPVVAAEAVPTADQVVLPTSPPASVPEPVVPSPSPSALPSSVSPSASAPASPPVSPPARPAPAPAKAALPRPHERGQLRLSVPALGVDTDTLALGTDKNNALEVPKTAQGVGWYRDGYLPGDVGPAVFAGHINLNGRDGTFSKLSTMRPGQEVFTVRPDGTPVRFVVTKVEQHPKNAFPTDAVYGPTTAPELRLITCGGSFDRGRGSYRDNIVVFARLA
jgi:hypothetical protein